MEESFWVGKPSQVAKALLGKCIEINGQFIWVLEARGYGRDENATDGLYRPMLDMPAGAVYCPKRRNSVLLLLVVEYEGASGHCVLVRKAEMGGVVYDGPGKLTQALGLDTHAMRGEIKWVGEDHAVVTFTDVPAARPAKQRSEERPRPRQVSGIGKEGLKKLMPTIARAFMRAGEEGQAFQDFVNGLLREHRTAASLRKALREMKK